MKKVMGLLILAGLALGGCGNNDCDDAADKFKECGITTEGSGSGSGDCSGANECAAKCVKNASCEQLKVDITSTATNPYLECVLKCGS